MGVHHFTLCLIPPGVSADRYDDGFLRNHSVPETILQRLRILLPKNRSWGDTEEFESDAQWPSDLRIWKEEDGTIFSIVFRYSPIADPKETLFTYLDIARKGNLLIYEPQANSILKPEPEEIVPLFIASASNRFLSDPEGTLLEAAEKTKQS